MVEDNRPTEEMKKLLEEYQKRVEKLEDVINKKDVAFEKKLKQIKDDLRKTSSVSEVNYKNLRGEIKSSLREAKESQEKAINDVNNSIKKSNKSFAEKMGAMEEQQKESSRRLEAEAKAQTKLSFARWRDGTEAGKYFAYKWTPEALHWKSGYNTLTDSWTKLVKQAVEEEIENPKNWEGNGWLKDAKETGQFYKKPILKKEPKKPEIEPYENDVDTTYWFRFGFSPAGLSPAYP